MFCLQAVWEHILFFMGKALATLAVLGFQLMSFICAGWTYEKFYKVKGTVAEKTICKRSQLKMTGHIQFHNKALSKIIHLHNSIYVITGNSESCAVVGYGNNSILTTLGLHKSSLRIGCWLALGYSLLLILINLTDNLFLLPHEWKALPYLKIPSTGTYASNVFGHLCIRNIP